MLYNGPEVKASGKWLTILMRRGTRHDSVIFCRAILFMTEPALYRRQHNCTKASDTIACVCRRFTSRKLANTEWREWDVRESCEKAPQVAKQSGILHSIPGLYQHHLFPYYVVAREISQSKTNLMKASYVVQQRHQQCHVMGRTYALCQGPMWPSLM